MGLEFCRVVLVKPHYAGNIGAAARVMRNLGLKDLVLVDPVANLADRQARQLSTHGEAILRGARIVTDFESAVSDCVTVAGTSARTGGLFRRQTVDFPDAIMPHLVATLRAKQSAALVFGPEPSGLTNAEVTRCHYLITIPTADEYPSLNLAQAVAICLYELRRAWLKTEPVPASPSTDADTPATAAAQEHLFGQLRAALEEIHFLYGPKAESLMHALRHLLGRARLSIMEVEILLGLARQIRWYVAQARHGHAVEHPPSFPNPLDR
jgi:tRNA/rRNA methyltransferase